ncbi:MAG: histidine triad nucleotide-binding protein [Acidobacteria bacterium]|nr:MAG: histidine triad nucleotide-binding protein [Acidobacteriota bacterium]
MSEQDCLFCKIINGNAAADVVYQDNRCVVIRDINPQAPTHVLVIPREHIESLDDASQKDETLLGHLLRISARVANEHGLSDSGGYRAVINTGRGAGQSVFHLHVHVLGGREMTWPPG